MGVRDAGLHDDVLSALLLDVAAGDRLSFARLFDALGDELHTLLDRRVDDSAALDLWVAIWQHAPRLARMPGSVRDRLARFAAKHYDAADDLPVAS